VEHERWGTPVASYVAGLPPDARPLDRGKPRDEDTEGGNQPADKSLINRRLSLYSQPCAAMAFLADGELAERALNRASPLDREHKRLGHRLINRIQIRAAASLTSARWLASCFSKRVAMARKCLSLLKKRSTRLRKR
jgi:hypothetical protein